jgi:hypothetical protein
VSRRGAVVGALACAAALIAWGAVLSPGAPSPGGHVPAQIAVRVAVLNPSTGAVVWSSVPLSGHLVMNLATGSIVSSDQAVLSPSGGSR